MARQRRPGQAARIPRNLIRVCEFDDDVEAADVGYDTLWRLANVLGFGIGLVPRDAARAGQPLFDPARFPGFKG